MNPTSAPFNFDNTYAALLAGFYVPWQAEAVPSPRLLFFNQDLASELGLDGAALGSDAGAAIFAGNEAPTGATPLAQAYAGHQFGGFSPQLGDGRALLLGEVVDRHGQRRDIQLKGSGRTPFSRGGDGKAAVGPVLREYLIGEAMHALNIPTTRALAAVATGESIRRETDLPGAVLTRVAASHIRVGTFEFFAARGETAKVKQLADYTIARHYPDLTESTRPYLDLFGAVAEAQAALIARWMQVGFVHGVMNTDNMAISGETIDYGPCAFIDAYDPRAVFSSIDHEGRYGYGNQPLIGQWNLTRFAETLVDLIDPDRDEAVRLLTGVIDTFPVRHRHHWIAGMRAKIGLSTAAEGDHELVAALLAAMGGRNADFTLVFRRLAEALVGNVEPARSLFADPSQFDLWLPRWKSRCEQEPTAASARAAAMNRNNPIYIPRNHQVERALVAAERGNLAPFAALLTAITKPFDERPELAEYAEPAPADFGEYKTFCGT